MTKPPGRTLVIYPFLFGIYPVLALIAHNIAEMPLTAGLRAMGLSLLITSLVYLVLYFLIENSSKAALLVSLVLLLIFSYGHLLNLLHETPVLNFSLGRHRTLAPLYSGLFIIIAAIIQKTKRDLSTLTKFLNAFAIILLIFPIYQILSYQVKVVIAEMDQRRAIAATSAVSLPQDQPAPDVYYILTDGYPRSDFITEYLGYDNSEFLDYLSSKGFYVAQCSQSNYTDTRFSMASTFNMIYLNNGSDQPRVDYPKSTLESMINNGTVQQNFFDLGYTIVTFDTGYYWLELENSAIHLGPTKKQLDQKIFNIDINDFEYLLFNTTAGKLVLDMPYLLYPDKAEMLAQVIEKTQGSHRHRVIFTLEELPDVPDSITGPKFVYAHMIFPHPPYIFDAKGNRLNSNPQNELIAYGEQIAYLDRRLTEIVDTLLEKSNPKPIIIIQSDHGASIEYESYNIDLSNRLGILNAYYFPMNSSGANPADQLYSTITPINTFRTIFDQYFNGDYGLLEDKSIVGRQSPITTIECPITELN